MTRKRTRFQKYEDRVKTQTGKRFTTQTGRVEDSEKERKKEASNKCSRYLFGALMKNSRALTVLNFDSQWHNKRAIVKHFIA